MQAYEEFFRSATGFPPYQWQKEVAEGGFPDLLTVPTGLGKTEGVVLAWAWRLREGKGEPRHLVYCLPMRVLVRQTVERLRRYFDALKSNIRVYELMGGAIDEEWARHPERPWVLVGTQDQLLSRALNRGYSMNRFEWPVHFGLLNNDCRWIVDEVQLMGPGLWTTAQLDWMRRRRFGTLFDCPTTWMSATVWESFLATKDRKSDGLAKPSVLPADVIENDSNRQIQHRLAARRPIKMWPPNGLKKSKKPSGDDVDIFYQNLSSEVKKNHVRGTLSLVICNTVEAAHRVFKSLPADDVPKVLLTSRFRREDREAHERTLLGFEAKRKQIEAQREKSGGQDEVGKPLPNDPGLICVSTQVVEAGVDVSAHRLWSEIAPWPSVIQRLGRLNRDGRDQQARAWFWEPPVDGRKERKKTGARIGPYEVEDVERGGRLVQDLARLSRGRPFYAALKKLNTAKVRAAVQPRPEPFPRALDVHSLFSTERDVHGGFTDVSVFVRDSDPNADLTVVWRDWDGGTKKAPPAGDDLDGPPLDVASEGCPVPFYQLRETLKSAKTRAWIWNDEDDRWEEIRPDDLRPGMLVMLHREAGGYSPTLGWTGNASDRLDDVPRVGRGRALRDDERTELGYWGKLDAHLEDARRQAEELSEAISLPQDLRTAVVEAAGLHDLGKAHPQWQQALPGVADVGAGPWAKCPRVLAVDVAGKEVDERIAGLVATLRPGSCRLADEQRLGNGREIVRLRWALEQRLKRKELDQLRAIKGVLWAGHASFRPNMRHEAASALAMWHRYRAGQASYPALAVYLAAAHHGKVRTVFRSLTDTGEDAFGVPLQPTTLTWNGQSWPLDFSVVKDGAEGRWEDREFVLTGHGWTGLVADLLGPWRPAEASSAGVVPDSEPKKLGPFRLAYLEALVRIADWRASENPSSCVKPSEVPRGK
jgi:CRISPR-associated endonuclease/helicase Cas3